MKKLNRCLSKGQGCGDSERLSYGRCFSEITSNQNTRNKQFFLFLICDRFIKSRTDTVENVLKGYEKLFVVVPLKIICFLKKAIFILIFFFDSICLFEDF